VSNAPLGTRVTLLALASLATACASTAVAPGPAPFPGLPRATAAARSEPALAPSGIVHDALALRGVPYRLGGDTPASGLDCSGLVRYVFLEQRIAMPRTVVEQYEVGRGISRSELRPGDLVFFETEAPGPSHVGIVINGTEFVHAPGTGDVVRVDTLTTAYWSSRLLGARRVVGDTGASTR
jgi:cell wall-associated NlpC family hydrolase